MRRSHVTTVSLLVALALASCTNAKDVLEPSAITPPAASAQPAPGVQGSAAATVPAPSTAAPATSTAGASATTTTPLTSAQSAAILSKTRLQIAPIVGASVEAATPLTAELQTRARQRGITLAGSADQTATHVLKGYFSAISEGKDTTVIYVWDVYDPAGNRLHRINGQMKAPSASSGASAGADSWKGVSPATMQAIADQTIDQFAAFLGGKAG
ncbi:MULTISPECIES: hypothetical protein [Mesorhizobium]|jgi:hypothetical protein|uniref:Uncharacterized protein n=1 Tax=Rhizobium loti TaxID=381 RepID=A0A6M7TYA9_RHILI|nr:MULTISPECIES: hypothetical protein [Mesorhizobium]KRB18481.1 hypothetical protein ASE05_27710 [Mesorhizobium sp. Root172]OBQ60657.1 hypothetical protein A8145_22185 [Mesorhizobium loti]QKC69722.1 hypothetical protein EB815_11600 [Mesorhizobium loti]QKC89010.1 hypothetical protein EB230_11615 [Mesorhizobium sp. NZP2234]